MSSNASLALREHSHHARRTTAAIVALLLLSCSAPAFAAQDRRDARRARRNADPARTGARGRGVEGWAFDKHAGSRS